MPIERDSLIKIDFSLRHCYKFSGSDVQMVIRSVCPSILIASDARDNNSLNIITVPNWFPVLCSAFSPTRLWTSRPPPWRTTAITGRGRRIRWQSTLSIGPSIGRTSIIYVLDWIYRFSFELYKHNSFGSSSVLLHKSLHGLAAAFMTKPRLGCWPLSVQNPRYL